MMYRLVAAAFALLVALPLAASAQQSPAPLQVPAAAVYPFTCNMSGATNALTVISGGIDKIAFAVSKGATALGLDPGQCAFNDRAVRPAEPKTLCVTGIVETNMTYKGLTVTGGGFNTTSGGKLAQFLIFGGSSKIMNFTVMNSGSCFTIVSFVV